VKLSGITFKISLFGNSTQFLAISRTLIISSFLISSPETAIIHLLLTTSIDEELNEMYAQATCSPAILSASSRDLSKFCLNSSISSIFHFLIALEETTQTHKTANLFLSFSSNLQMTVFILEPPISIDVIILSKLIFI
jgi:hypothetical protein